MFVSLCIKFTYTSYKNKNNNIFLNLKKIYIKITHFDYHDLSSVRKVSYERRSWKSCDLILKNEAYHGVFILVTSQIGCTATVVAHKICCYIFHLISNIVSKITGVKYCFIAIINKNITKPIL